MTVHRLGTDGRYAVVDASFELTGFPIALAEARTKAGVPAERFFVTALGETRRIAPMLKAAGEAQAPASR